MASLVSPKKKVGRGGARGGTACRGHKGQKARSGGSIPPWFEGGQLPLIRRLPKRGFNNKRFQTPVTQVSLFELNRFADGDEVTKEALWQSGIVKKHPRHMKILANGTVDKKLTVYTDAITASAKKAIEDQGGSVYITKE